MVFDKAIDGTLDTKQLEDLQREERVLLSPKRTDDEKDPWPNCFPKKVTKRISLYGNVQ
jgi:hypothetical protein